MKTDVNARNGSALVAVLGIVAAVSVVCGMLSVAAVNQARATQINCDMLKARMIGESGLNKAYQAIKGNFALVKGGYVLSEAFAGGTYSVRSVALAGAGQNRAQLFAEGLYGAGKVVVAADLTNCVQVVGSGSPDYFPLDFDFLVGGTMTISGNFHLHVSQMHSNGNADLGGSTSSDPCVISSAGTAAWKKKPANVTLLSGQQARVVYPASLEAAINKLKASAQANGAVYANGSQIPSSPPGGIAYCTGSDTGWSGDGTGCFIFDGVFNNKHVNITAPDGYPALVVLSPCSMQFNAGAYIYGALLLPSASLFLNGHAAIYGPLLVGQNLSANGTADLWEGSGQGLTTPPSQTVLDKAVITAWH
jgi:hypothetical protein